MAEPLRVDPTDLRVGHAYLRAALDAAAGAHDQHQAALSEASSGWIGESKRALHELAAHWAERHSVRHTQVSTTAQALLAAAASYANTDDDSAQTVEKSAADLGL